MTLATAAAINNGVWRDTYNIYAEGLKRLEDPDFWAGFFWPSAEAICAKYDQNPFCIELLIAVHSELERGQKEAKRGGEMSYGAM